MHAGTPHISFAHFHVGHAHFLVHGHFGRTVLHGHHHPAALGHVIARTGSSSLLKLAQRKTLASTTLADLA
jgi:hypothetical protein